MNQHNSKENDVHRIHRRSFFQGALTAAAAVRVAGANDAIAVGLIGLGLRGTFHLNTWSRNSGARITALCDVNQAAREQAQASLRKQSHTAAAEFADMRELFASSKVDAVSIATPNHWHALAAIWACEAGKDVYVEKPASHNIFEGWRMTEAARKHNRMVQVGSQGRSIPHLQRAMHRLREGAIGEVYLVRGLCFKRRKSIGKTPTQPVPAGVDWDRFLGPAPARPFTMNRFRYNWHWFWDTGNGDLGNQGVHQMDICRWALGDPPMADWVVSSGGKFVYDDDQETPNTQHAAFGFQTRQIHFEVRGLPTGPEGGLRPHTGNTVGNVFLGSRGWMWADHSGYQVYEEGSATPVAAESASKEDAMPLHVENFLEACRRRNHRLLAADIEIGAASAAMCHMANISYRCGGRKLTWDDAGRRFHGDAVASGMISRDYRRPYTIA